ncbi:MAG TPA: hypothetical protein VKV03_12265 [Candidatus Binataceae bacterium]|nr:hypothetical protein [Candidatus Binataceae bacterium]
MGRRRKASQNRGLRPLFPRLPTSFQSRAVRVAMTTPAWNRIDTLMAERAQQTRPRALGEVIETLLAHFDTSLAAPWEIAINSEEPLTNRVWQEDWQDWQMRKERALLPALQVN